MKVKLLKQLMFASKQMFYIFLLQVAMLQMVYAKQTRSQSIVHERVSIGVKNAALDKIFAEIEKQTDFVFMYDAAILKDEQKNTLNCKNQPVANILKKIGEDYHLDFKQINSTIYVKKNVLKVTTAEDKSDQQPTRKISGKVTDKAGNALPGVSVSVKGSANGTVTAADGSFSLNIRETDNMLDFSFIGMKTIEESVSGKNELEISMEDESYDIDEVVAVGYGTKQKKDLTGAVSVVDVKSIANTPVAGVDQMMQGRTAGVNIMGDYAPGGGVSVRIRGFSTIRNNDPLYIIDGVPVESGINMINPDDIESIQILKDASSASIYGARAANGVIIITTKKGKGAKEQLTFDAYYGLQSATNKLTPLNALGYGDLLWQAHANDGKTPASDIYGNGSTAVIPQYLDVNHRVPSADINWVDEIMSDATVQSYNLNLSKGTETASHLFSLGYYGQDGIIKYTNFDRVSARFNSQYKFFNALVIGENVSLSNSWTNEPGTNSMLGSTVYDAYKYPSIAPVYDLDGNFAGAFMNDIGNPLASLYYNKDNTRKNLKLFGNVFAEVEPVKGLKLKSNLGIDYSNFYFRDFSPKYQETGAQNPNTISSLTTTNTWNFNWVWTNTLNYAATIGQHQVDFLAGVESIKSTYEGFSGFRQGFPYEAENFRYLNAGDGGTQINSGTGSGWSLLSYFAKADYTYDNRYLFSFTIRRDGSSKLGNNKWGNFPAFSLGWRISEENFFNKDKISNLKLRLGWGQNGNQDVPPYATIESYSTNANYSNYAIDGSQNSVSSGFTQTRNGNPNLKWETTTQTNLGLDLGLFNNQFNVTADYFIKKTKDLLLQRPLPPVAGGTNQTVWDNVGSMENKGFELLFEYEIN